MSGRNHVIDDGGPLAFFVAGEPYRLFGLIPFETHFFGVDREVWRDAHPDQPAMPWYFLGADRYGHDLFSRMIYGACVSLFIGGVAIAITFILGVLIGGVSGYLGAEPTSLFGAASRSLTAFPNCPCGSRWPPPCRATGRRWVSICLRNNLID